MRGQSIRALAAAPSDPKILIAGTLKGVYRSTDGGEHWKLISPEGSQEIHEVESIAIDPANSEIIYAGTWHLPWKTTDGGATLDQHQAGHHRRFGCVLDHRRSEGSEHGVRQCVFGNLQEPERRRKVSEGAGNSFDGTADAEC